MQTENTTTHSQASKRQGEISFGRFFEDLKATLREANGLGILVGYLATTFFLTHVNLSGTVFDHKNLPSSLSLLDKCYHFVAYTILTFLVLYAFTNPKTTGRNKKRIRLTSAKRLCMWCCFIVVYGIFDECTQPFFGRNFEVFDLLANLVGIATGQMLLVLCEVTGFREKLNKML